MQRPVAVIRVWRVILFILGSAVIALVLYRYYGISGEFSYVYQFNQTGTVISEFTPHGRALDRERNSENGEFYQRIVSDPVYFSVQLPSAYPELQIEIDYQNPNQSIVELGVQLSDDTTQWAYDLQPLENKFVDDSTWERVESDDYVLLQREPTYVSVEEFLAQPPKQSRVGTYRTNLNLPLTDDTYQPSDRTIDLTTALRGRHELFTYTNGTDLDFTFDYEDINYLAGQDDWSIDVYYLNELVLQQPVIDSDDPTWLGQSAGRQQQHITLSGPTPGVYKIVLNAADDIVFTHIQSPLDRLVFAKTLHLAGSTEYVNVLQEYSTAPTVVYSDASLVVARAKHQAGVQAIEFYDTELNLDRVDIPFIWRNPIANYHFTATIPQNDVYLETDTAFALDKDQWFDPWFGFHALQSTTDASKLDYVLAAQYTEPTRLRGTTTATATFDLTKVSRVNPTKIDLVVSAPGLDTTAQGLKIKRITVTATKEPITLRNLWTRLRAKLF